MGVPLVIILFDGFYYKPTILGVPPFQETIIAIILFNGFFNGFSTLDQPFWMPPFQDPPIYIYIYLPPKKHVVLGVMFTTSAKQLPSAASGHAMIPTPWRPLEKNWVPASLRLVLTPWNSLNHDNMYTWFHGGVPKKSEIPKKMLGLFHGNYPTQMDDDWG